MKVAIWILALVAVVAMGLWIYNPITNNIGAAIIWPLIAIGVLAGGHFQAVSNLARYESSKDALEKRRSGEPADDALVDDQGAVSAPPSSPAPQAQKKGGKPHHKAAKPKVKHHAAHAQRPPKAAAPAAPARPKGPAAQRAERRAAQKASKPSPASSPSGGVAG